MISQSMSITTSAMLEALRDPANQAVWSALDSRYRSIISAVAMRAGLRGEDASDVAQQTLVDVMTGFRAGQYDRAKGRFRTWILTIAHRRVIDVLRGRYRAADWRGDSAIDDHPNFEAIESSWNDETQKKIVHESLRLLDEECQASPTTKRAFELVQLRGVPEESVAKECGISVDQVYVIKHRMLKRLREIIERLQEAYGMDEWTDGSRK